MVILSSHHATLFTYFSRSGLNPTIIKEDTAPRTDSHPSDHEAVLHVAETAADASGGIKEEGSSTAETAVNIPDVSNVDLSQFDDSDVQLQHDGSSSESDSNGDSDDSDSDSDSDSEDEEELLLRELAKIKAEKEAEKKRQAAEEATIAKQLQDEDAMLSNPILRQEFEKHRDLMGMASSTAASGSAPVSTAVKRRWDDDVVFRNQARDEKEVKKRFINDTVRSDFHRAFLNKYMR